MIIVVLAPDAEIYSIAFCTSNSDFESRADVASSSTNIKGFLINALAIAILCF